MITGIFLFLLGTKLGEATTRTQVKYEGPNKITINEDKEENIVVPGLGSPPFAPSFIHQGSNFLFNPQIVLPEGFIPTGFERGLIPFPPQESISIKTEVIENKTIQNLEVIVPEIPAIVIPQIEIEEPRPMQIEILPQPNPNVQLLVEEPSLPCVEINNVIPGLPLMIEEPVQYPELYVSEVDVRVNEIPPPPVLPPLLISEIPKPVVVEDKRVILIPSAPELTSFYPPSIMVAENPLIPTDCAQNIVLERFIPNVAFQNGKTLELISIPATKRPPVVSSIIY